MTVLLDSSAWIEYFRGTARAKAVAELIESDKPLFAATINIAETYRHLLRLFPHAADEHITVMLERCLIIPLDVKIALHAAKLVEEKRLGLADAIVLASARSHKLKVLTLDNDFRGEPDAEVV